MKDHYKILGISPNCTQAEIKKAYRLLAVQYHPDKNNGEPASEERFKEVLESYTVLGDDATRAEYDYIKGYKTTYKSLRAEHGKPTPVSFLTQFQRVKNTALNAGKHMNRQALFKVLEGLLSDQTILLLITEKDHLVNSRIIDEVLTCCVFLNAENKQGIHARLTKLANGHKRLLDKLEQRNKEQEYTPPKNIPVKPENTDAAPAVTTILIFVLFIVLFVLLWLVA